VSRELRRNSGAGGYGPFDAHRLATARRARDHRCWIDIHDVLRSVVVELLGQRWSPQQISRHLRRLYPQDWPMWLWHESIYKAIYRPGSLLLRARATASLAAAHRS